MSAFNLPVELVQQIFRALNDLIKSPEERCGDLMPNQNLYLQRKQIILNFCLLSKASLEAGYPVLYEDISFQSQHFPSFAQLLESTNFHPYIKSLSLTIQDASVPERYTILLCQMFQDTPQLQELVINVAPSDQYVALFNQTNLLSRTWAPIHLKIFTASQLAFPEFLSIVQCCRQLQSLTVQEWIFPLLVSNDIIAKSFEDVTFPITLKTLALNCSQHLNAESWSRSIH